MKGGGAQSGHREWCQATASNQLRDAGDMDDGAVMEGLALAPHSQYPSRAARTACNSPRALGSSTILDRYPGCILCQECPSPLLLLGEAPALPPRLSSTATSQHVFLITPTPGTTELLPLYQSTHEGLPSAHLYEKGAKVL